jgi:D-serine deaminase-like pyridoxal phosphate-dependent protein
MTEQTSSSTAATFLAACHNLPQTPALVVDLATADRNIQHLATYARTHQLQVRPHTKTHKSLFFAQRQLAAGATGLTTAKVGEAEIMSAASSNLLIAYPTVDTARAARVAQLAKHHTVLVALDSSYGVQSLAAAARQLDATIGILIDVDVGFHRTGVASLEDSVRLAREVVAQTPRLRLEGLFCYPGQIWVPPDQQSEQLHAVSNQLQQILDAWATHDLPANIVSGGSTPTAYQSHLVPQWTEIRPGTSLFNDMNTVRGRFCSLEDCAAAVVATIVSTAVPGKAVMDAGTKALTSDRNATQPDSGFGLVLEYPQARISRLSEEHGELEFAESAPRPQVGDRVTIIPNHICPCVNLQNQIWLQTPDGRLQSLSVDARGLLT